MSRTHLSVGRTAGLATAAAAGMLAASVVPASAAIPPPTSEDQIAAVVEGMSLDQLIGQMTWTQVYGSTADEAGYTTGDPAQSNQSRYGVDTPAEVVEKYDLGGVLYFAWSNPVVTNDPEGTAELSNALQEASTGEDGSGIPLAVTIDQEGGIVARMGPPVTVLPGNMALGATFDPELAYAQGGILGEELAAVGVNVNFAPVVDVNTNPANPVIGVRSMGEDPVAVAALGVGQILGMQEQNVGAAAKHFPGHGDTETDSHTGLPIVTYDRETLDQHLLPFQAAIEADVDMIMTAHVIVEAIDPDLPGTLSHDVLTGLLREEMGFDGLITTDALDMAALKELPDNPLTDGEIAVLAIQAGSDILLMSPDVPATFEAITEAVENDELTRERLEESVTRILEWKLERGVWEIDPSVDVDAVMDVVGDAEHLATAAEISERAVTLLRNEGDVLPLDVEEDSILMTGAGAAWPERLGPLLNERGFDVTEAYQEDYLDDEGEVDLEAYQAAAVALAEGVDVIVYASYNATGSTTQQAMVDALAETGKPVIVVAARNPYDISVFPDADAVLNIYGWNVVNYHGAVAAIAGDINPSGNLPVNVPTADGEGVLLPIGFGLRYGTEAIPAEIVFTDEPGTENDSYTVPAAEGVAYFMGEEQLDDGVYPGEGTVTITAVPLEGYYFGDETVTEWTFTFDATAPTEEPTTEEPTTEPPTTEPPTTDEPTTAPTAPGGGGLPSTGAELTGLAAAGVLLLLAGAGALALRRRQLG